MTNDPFGAPKRARRGSRQSASSTRRHRRVYVVALERPAQALVRLADNQQEAEGLGMRARENGALVVYCEQAPKVGRVIAEWLRGKIPQGAR